MKMKIRSKINQFFSLFWVVLIVCLTGCVNLIDEPEVNSFSTESSVMVTGSFDLDLEGAFPKEILSIVNNSKNAVPNVPTLYYQIQAENITENATNTGEKIWTKCGTDQNFVIYLSHRPGQTDRWKLTAQAFIADTAHSSNPSRYAEENIVFESSTNNQLEIEIGENQPSFYINSPIQLSPVDNNMIYGVNVGGVINLPVYWENQIGLTKIQYQIDNETPQIITVNPSQTLANINPSDKLSKGGHNLKMDFFAGYEIIYSLTEKIFSFVNLTTDTWVANHYSSNPVEYFESLGGGRYNLKITRDCVNHYRQNTFYVSDSGTSPDDGGRGTYYKPFRTLTQALTEIHKRPANGDYTIYIVPVSERFTNPSDDETAYIEDGTLTSTGGLRRVSIVGYGDGDGKVAVVCSSANTCFLKVPEGLNDYFILENLAFYSWSTQIIDTTKGVAAVNCNFSGTSSSLGSPYFKLLSGTSSSTYLNNCTFDSFSGTATGTNSPLYMEGTAYIENCIFNNNQTANGGAIYCNNLTLEIKDSTFSNNTATSDGGAIYITGASNVTIGGNTVFETNIAEGSTSSGGAINISSNSSSTLLIKDNVRFGDASEAAKANIAKCGSAICITGASVSVTIQDKVSIEGNIAYSDNVNGSGAIFVCQGATLTIGKEGEPNTLSPKIYKNTTFKSGTINIADGTLNFNSGVISENVVTDSTTAYTSVKAPAAGAIFSNSSSNTININGGQIINNKCNNCSDVQQPMPGGIFTYSMNIKGPAEIYGNKYVIIDNPNTEQKLDIFLCTDSSPSSNKYINIAGALTSIVDENKLINITLSNATNYEYSDDASSDKKIIGKQTGATYNNEVFTSAAEHFENAEEYAVEYYLNTGTDCINYNKTTDVSVVYSSLPNNIAIKSKEQFIAILDFINNGNNFTGKTITLYKDIEIEDGFEGANDTSSFAGIFDGNGKKIVLSNTDPNIYFKDNHTHSIFGKVSKSGTNIGTIKNLTVEGNITVNSDDGLYLFCSELNGGLIENCTNKCNIKNTHNNLGDDITGIVGIVKNNGTVKGCINEGNFEGGQMAGICHELQDGNIVNCGNKGRLNSKRNTYTGGVVRTVSVNGGYIVNCYNEADITGFGKCGGLVGECCVTNTNIINCYSSGYVHAAEGFTGTNKIGGLVGEVYPQMKIMNCYYSTNNVPCVGYLDSSATFTGTLKYVQGFSLTPFSPNTTSLTGYSFDGLSGSIWYNGHLSECSTGLPSGITLETWIDISGCAKFTF